MKLDMNRAWTDALGLIQSNIGVVAVVAGVFFFLPYLAFALLMPDMATTMNFEPSEDPSVAMDQIMALYGEIWWAILLLAVTQTIGTLALLAMLQAEDRPTVGEAIGIGAVGFLTYFVATIVAYIGFGILGGLLFGVAVASQITALAVIVGLIVFIAIVYIAIKFSLLTPVIAIDKVFNPFKALARSWRLTKGNSLRILAFFLLLIVAAIVISLVLSLLVTLIFGLAGPEVSAIGVGMFNAVLNAVYVVLMLGVLAAIHRQLAIPDADPADETFE